MSMNFRTLPDSKLKNLDAIQALEEITVLNADIERNFGKLDRANEVLDNIHLAVESLNKYGDTDAAVIAICNASRELEVLTKKPLKDITKEAALEALESTEKSGWDKFVEAVKAIIAKIVAFLRALFTSTDHKIEYLKTLTEWTPSEQKYSVLSKENAAKVNLLVQDTQNYADQLLNKANQIYDSLRVGEDVASLSATAEELYKKYNEFLVLEKMDNVSIIKWVPGDSSIMPMSTLAEAGYTDINRVKVFISDINFKVLNAIERVVFPMVARLEQGLASLGKKVGEKSENPSVVETSKYIKPLINSLMSCLGIQAKASAAISRTITAIYTDAHKTPANAAANA